MQFRKLWHELDRGVKDEEDSWAYRFVLIAMVAAVATIVCERRWLVTLQDEDLAFIAVLPLAFLALLVTYILCHIILWTIRGMPPERKSTGGGPSIFGYLD